MLTFLGKNLRNLSLSDESMRNKVEIKTGAAIIVFLTVLLIAAVTTPHYGVSWDEPDSFFAGVQMIDKWIRAIKQELHNGRLSQVFSERFTRRFWHPPTPETQKFDYYNNHPPVSRIFGFIFWIVFKNAVGDIISMRLSACFFFALMVSFIFIWGMDFSYFTAITSAIFTLTTPRMFAFAHLLTTEVFLTAFWVFTAFAFWRALRSQNVKWYLLGWFLFGFAINVKFTALIIPAPVFCFILLKYRGQFRKWLYSCPVCLIPAYLLNPTWWHHPIETFLHNYIFLSLFRTTYFNPPVVYFGNISLVAPWHYSIIMTLITVPAIILILFLTSIYLMIKNYRESQFILYSLLNIFIVLIIVSLPGAPRYDGVRLFLPIFPFAAMLAAESASTLFFSLRERFVRNGFNWQSTFLAALLSFLTVGYLVSQVIFYHPFELSYYNEFIGGLRGSYKYGMEATYWQEAVTPKFMDEVNQIVPQGATLSMYPVGFPMLRYLSSSGMLRKDFKITPFHNSDYIILVNRRSARSRAAFFYFMKTHKPVREINLRGVNLVTLFATRDNRKKINLPPTPSIEDSKIE